MITYQHSSNILKQNLRSTENSLRVLCFNLLSLSYHILELHNVLSKCDLNFQVIDINEPRLKQSKKKKNLQFMFLTIISLNTVQVRVLMRVLYSTLNKISDKKQGITSKYIKINNSSKFSLK